MITCGERAGVPLCLSGTPQQEAFSTRSSSAAIESQRSRSASSEPLAVAEASAHLPASSPHRLLFPPPRKHRHRYHGVFAPNRKIRPSVAALAIGSIAKRGEATHDGHARDGPVAAGCCDTRAKPHSHDTSRIAWAKLMARVGEEFPLQCPGCGGDIRLIAIITEPGPIRKILTHLGEPLESPLVSPARGPPTD